MSTCKAPEIDWEARYASVREKLRESENIMFSALEEHFWSTGHEVTAICVLFSGGNDSTTLTHIFKPVADAAVHINTGIGIEQTRQYVRDTCDAWDLNLIEKSPPPGSTYRELVLDQGFPGPGHHYKMFQRLKERGLLAVRREFVRNPRKQRILFLAGRRRDESKRRMNIPEIERVGSIVWASPLVHWTKEDLNTYRRMNPEIPRNQVSDTLHMSGECLCGSFAHKGELDEIEFWYPEVAQEIRGLEEEVRAAGHPEKVCQWGWGGGKRTGEEKSGPLCTSCDSRSGLFDTTAR